MLGRPARHQHLARRRPLLCPRVLYVRRSELDVSGFDEAKQVASVAEEERRIIEAERRAARSRCLRRRSGRDDFGGPVGTLPLHVESILAV